MVAGDTCEPASLRVLSGVGGSWEGDVEERAWAAGVSWVSSGDGAGGTADPYQQDAWDRWEAFTLREQLPPDEVWWAGARARVMAYIESVGLGVPVELSERWWER